METLRTSIMVTGVPKKDHCGTESNYVDLGGSNTVKVSFAGERAVFKRKSELVQEHEDDRKDADLQIGSFLKSESEGKCGKPGKADYTDMYLNSRCESESESEDCDPDSSDHDMPVAEETESHYITTHEIQLTELDHDMDHELGRAASSCWDYEDENLVYSFVDYASFESGEPTAAERGGLRRATGGRAPKLAAAKALISTESECASSDDCGVRDPVGRVHLSVKASSLNAGDPVHASLHDDELLQCYHEMRASTMDSHAHCFIPAPGRQHLATKLMKGKDVTEYSSGASSSVSELDDADKEVRNLTAKSFRSLACPYFDTIDLRPSSESSVSEYSLSKFLDSDCRDHAARDQRKNSACSTETRARTENANAASEGKFQQASSRCKQSCDAERSFPNVSGVDQGEHKKGVFASSILQNLILKKMRIEREHEPKCGDGHARTDNAPRGALQSQTSESESVHSVVSVSNKPFSDEPEGVSQETCEPPKAEQSGMCESKVSGTTEPEGPEKEPQTNVKTTKMSHLFVPGSRFLPNEREGAEPSRLKDPVQSEDKNTSSLQSTNNSKAPEIRIRLRGVKDDKNHPQRPFNIASLLTPNLGKRGGDGKSEKVPHFTVRDVRDARCKLQTPIHQVRDVRKLVKSSYRSVSLESGENKSTTQEESDDDGGVKKEPDKNAKKEKTPMVIKCQSVNTNSNPAAANRRSRPECERTPLQPIPEQHEVQMKSSRWKDNRVESKMANQVALEKLKAAVKTMEQLYVFDRNEWRRKTEAPRPVTDSHVLSLITSEEQGVDADRLVKAEPTKPSPPCSDASFSRTLVPKIPGVRRSTTSSPSVHDPEPQPPAVSDSENYLTIPIKPRPLETNAEHIVSPAPQPRPPLQRSPVVTESWSPESPVLTFCQPAQILCVTPPTDPLVSNTERKLLLDPVTGQYYLVDTPMTLQPVTQRVYCSDSAQYLDVPVTLSPAAYLVCPSFTVPHSKPPCPQGASAAPGGAKPIISVTSQQGPRVMAPPSFDGTTMSFVVEHR